MMNTFLHNKVAKLIANEPETKMPIGWQRLRMLRVNAATGIKHVNYLKMDEALGLMKEMFEELKLIHRTGLIDHDEAEKILNKFESWE